MLNDNELTEADRDSLIEKLRSQVQRLRDANGELMADLSDCQDKRDASRAIEEVGGFDTDCWAAIVRERDRLRAERDHARHAAKLIIMELPCQRPNDVPGYKQDAKRRWPWLEIE